MRDAALALVIVGAAAAVVALAARIDTDDAQCGPGFVARAGDGARDGDGDAERARRYPWGDTGAVCRRAAWGLANGPCATKGRSPDTVGAHPDGASRMGVFDMAGNVAEWVTSKDDAKI